MLAGAADLTARLLLEYDGSGFAGWACQRGQRTVQDVLEQALAAAGSPVALSVAGRTDAGVHARGQVASHPGAPVDALRLNTTLPADVRVLRSEAAPEGFDARADARSRTYRYRVLPRGAASPLEHLRALHWVYALDRTALEAFARALLGTHDFTAFTPTQTDHVRFRRTVERAEWRDADNGVLEFWIEANSFMRHMVRTIVGTMLLFARRGDGPEAFVRLLEGHPRAEAGDTAAPHGLYLESVRY